MIIPGLITTNACSQALSGNQSCTTSTYCSFQPLLHMEQSSLWSVNMHWCFRTQMARVIYFCSVYIYAIVFYKDLLNYTTTWNTVKTSKNAYGAMSTLKTIKTNYRGRNDDFLWNIREAPVSFTDLPFLAGNSNFLDKPTIQMYPVCSLTSNVMVM